MISVALGKDWVGYVTAASAFADMLSSIAFGRLSDTLGRVPVLALGVVLNTITTVCVRWCR